MLRTLYLLLILLTFSSSAKAQTSSTHDIGFLAGGSYYLGDINTFGHYRNTHFAGMVFHRWNLNQRMSLKNHFTVGTVSGADSNSDDPFQQRRNLGFKSPVMELGSQFEINYFNYAMGKKEHPVSPYLFAGISIFRMNPQGEINGNSVALRPLGTEGQGIEGEEKKYPLMQLAIPFGLGLKVNLGKKLSAGFEWGVRKTFTDYLDDVSTDYVDPSLLADNNGQLALHFSDRSTSGTNFPGAQRGNASNKDWYVISGFFLSFKISKKNTCPMAL